MTQLIPMSYIQNSMVVPLPQDEEGAQRSTLLRVLIKSSLLQVQDLTKNRSVCLMTAGPRISEGVMLAHQVNISLSGQF